MNTSAPQSAQLELERAVNERYRATMKEAMQRDQRLVAQVTAVSKSALWTTGSAKTGPKLGDVAPLVGRVGFEGHNDELIAEELYIGPWVSKMGKILVVSWAAPVAQLFFRGRGCDDPLAPAVAVRRTFTSNGRDIIDFEDDSEVGHHPETVFGGASATMSVPAAPSSPRRPSARQRGRTPATTAPIPATPAATRPPVDTEEQAPRVLPGRPSNASAPDDGLEHGLRAERSVIEAVSQPRTGELHSVLATLQPDQFDLVTWPSTRHLIVSGKPGTGKTVVAMHRAGFLTHPEHPGGPLSAVAVIGPTDEYRDHVRKVSGAVGGAHVPVHGLPSFLAKLAGVDIVKMKPGPNDRVGVDWRMWSVITKAARVMELKRAPLKTRHRRLVEALVKPTDVHKSAARDSEQSAWLRSIGSFDRATNETRFLPFLAACAVVAMPTRVDRLDHLIVDEAQDVPPLVWRTLLELVHDGATMSVFGDMNQRRSDWTASSWEQLATDLDMTDDDGVAPLRTLTIGYRTTRHILRFANRLLPAKEREIHALRDGIPPEIRKVAPSILNGAVVTAADELTSRYPNGLTAVLTVTPRPISDAFRNAQWKRGTWRDSWTLGGRTVIVLHPDRARGLEFDGVVTVEPSDFPENLGRDGVLYTSLTRATQELLVVYSTSLPKNLRRPRSAKSAA